MQTNLLPVNDVSIDSFARGARRHPPAAVPFPVDHRHGSSRNCNDPANSQIRDFRSGRAFGAHGATVEVSPPDFVKRQIFTLEDMAVETVETTSRDRIDYRYCADHHLLVAYEQDQRSDGETFVEGLPTSSLRDLRKKLTFVPAGLQYQEQQVPRVSNRVLYFYFDPVKMPVRFNRDFTDFVPRLHFEDPVILEIALKLAAGASNTLYLEALGTVLAHELVRLNSRTPRVQRLFRGGLAAWQQRVIAHYIEKHLAEPIALPMLAQLVRLSPFYFCRAFKESFGMPPHRYLTSRRIERAKALLAKQAVSVTDVGFAVGYNETSSFSAVFRKTTGITPSEYRRAL